MDIKNKVCTLEQSMKFIELGVVLETEKYWMIHTNKTVELITNGGFRNMDTFYPAPDVAELGVVLPETVTLKDCSSEGCIGTFDWDLNRNDMVKYVTGKGWMACLSKQIFKTEAEARAEALIILIGHKLVNPESLIL